jgi:hypothetical protein
VGDVKVWYEKYHPELPAGSLVPGACYFCWQELEVGTAVVIRKSPTGESDVLADAVGVIQGVLSSETGRLFLVRLDSGQTIYFIRAQLRKLREGEVRPDRIIDGGEVCRESKDRTRPSALP